MDSQHFRAALAAVTLQCFVKASTVQLLPDRCHGHLLLTNFGIISAAICFDVIVIAWQTESFLETRPEISIPKNRFAELVCGLAALQCCCVAGVCSSSVLVWQQWISSTSELLWQPLLCSVIQIINDELLGTSTLCTGKLSTSLTRTRHFSAASKARVNLRTATILLRPFQFLKWKICLWPWYSKVPSLSNCADWPSRLKSMPAIWNGLKVRNHDVPQPDTLTNGYWNPYAEELSRSIV